MLHVARKRFAGIDNVSYLVADYSRELPAQDFDVIVSALSIHHLENVDKETLFDRIYDKLPEGGLFVNYDWFCAGQADMDNWFDSYWESQLADSGLTDTILHYGKSVKCVYSYQKFSVIIAMK